MIKEKLNASKRKNILNVKAQKKSATKLYFSKSPTQAFKHITKRYAKGF